MRKIVLAFGLSYVGILIIGNDYVRELVTSMFSSMACCTVNRACSIGPIIQLVHMCVLLIYIVIYYYVVTLPIP